MAGRILVTWNVNRIRCRRVHSNSKRKVMRKLAIFGLLALSLTVLGCGSSSTTTAQTTTSGFWQAQLTGGAGEASALDFVTNFTVNGDGSLAVSSFSFFTTQTCFVSGETESGTANVTTNSSNVVTGSVSFVVTSGNPAGNTLTLTGTENGNTITGSWTLTGGSGCTGGGSFTMTKS
jgi:hypothetical protein